LSRRVVLILLAGGVIAVVLAALAGSLMAVLGAELPCAESSGGTLGVSPTRAALSEIPPTRLPLYREAGKRYEVNWTFLASIGTQECSTGTCGHVYPSGCGGPMQIAIERESACSPGSGPTIWERYGVDANGDGHADPFNLADAIFTAARMMRPVFGLAGQTYADYHQAACNYYGACADAVAAYAAEVMARAVRYGFRAPGAPTGGAAESESAAANRNAPPPSAPAGSTCAGSSQLLTGRGPMGAVHKATSPRHLAPLPAAANPAEPGIECDSRIIPDVVYLVRRFGLTVTACYAIHAPDGEHPLGAAIDVVPDDGNWDRTLQTAEALGWKGSCALSGVVPICAQAPFRFIGYNGYPGHGDPAHCLCGGDAHLHLSWLTSASIGEPENRPRYTYEAPSWIEVFDVPGESASDGTAAEPNTETPAATGPSQSKGGPR
jgi:hypothetical protein